MAENEHVVLIIIIVTRGYCPINSLVFYENQCDAGTHCTNCCNCIDRKRGRPMKVAVSSSPEHAGAVGAGSADRISADGACLFATNSLHVTLPVSSVC